MTIFSLVSFQVRKSIFLKSTRICPTKEYCPTNKNIPSFAYTTLAFTSSSQICFRLFQQTNCSTGQISSAPTSNCCDGLTSPHGLQVVFPDVFRLPHFPRSRSGPPPRLPNPSSRRQPHETLLLLQNLPWAHHVRLLQLLQAEAKSRSARNGVWHSSSFGRYVGISAENLA